MIYLELILGFLKVGCFSFGGGYGAIPLIRDVVLNYKWLTDEELTYMIAVSESTPGPIMVNMATYIGSSQAGLTGALIATFFVVLPTFLIVLIVLTILSKAIRNKYFQAALNGVKPCITGIILATGAYMLVSNLFKKENSYSCDFKALIIAILLVGCIIISKYLLKKKISPILLIVISAVCGVIIY